VPTVMGLTFFSADKHDPTKDAGVVEIKDGKKSYIYTQGKRIGLYESLL
jgi:hypothetical protein